MRRSAVHRALALALVATPFVFAACHRTSDGESITSTNETNKPTKKPAKRRGKEPTNHRATAMACPAGPTKGDVAPAASGSAAAPFGHAGPAKCKSDAECTEGKNGRCAMTGGGRLPPHADCVYDQCFADADCGAKSECVCGGSPGRGNVCMQGNCATDADCGDGYCSPSYGLSCGPYTGYVGNYCHTADDECTNDDECKKGGKSEYGYCAWYPELGHWKCGYGFCVG
jgi:hypothetical protein